MTQGADEGAQSGINDYVIAQQVRPLGGRNGRRVGCTMEIRVGKSWKAYTF